MLFPEKRRKVGTSSVESTTAVEPPSDDDEDGERKAEATDATVIATRNPAHRAGIDTIVTNPAFGAGTPRAAPASPTDSGDS